MKSTVTDSKLQEFFLDQLQDIYWAEKKLTKALLKLADAATSDQLKSAFLNQPGQADIQSDLFYDYRTNVEAYPKWQAWMRERQPRLLVIWGRYDMSFDPSEPEAYRRDVPEAKVHILDAGHFALDTAADEIAALVRTFAP